MRVRVCCWCRTEVQPKPGTPYCEIMGRLFLDYPWQCARGDSPKGTQPAISRLPKYAVERKATRRAP
jgi:hypothetical protein